MPNHCPVCRMPIRDTLAVCQACETPHHPDCWEFGRGCAIFACGSQRARVLDADAFQPAVVELVLDGTEADPPWFQPGREAPPLPPEASGLRPPGSGSRFVLLVSWLYLALSLICAIPAAGGLVRTFTGQVELLGWTLACAGIAAAIKHVGDLIAVGDPHGRAAHAGLCAVVAGVSGSLALSLLLIALCAPFWSRRGREYFGASRG